MPDTPNIVQFPLPDEEEEHTRRVMAEVERLSNLSPAEWKFQCTRRAEVFGIEPDTLKELVEAKVEERERKERKAQVAERDRSKLQRLADRNRQREDASKQKAEKKAELEKRKAEREAEKEAARKAKEKKKSFNNLLKLPVDHQEKELQRLAEQLGMDLPALRQEFKKSVGIADGFSMASSDSVEPWPEPVNTAELLQDIEAKLAKYVVLLPHHRTAPPLWAAHAWVHNEIATHSPILMATSAEADSGKSTLLGALARLVPKPSLSVESTGPNVYRYVDAHKPTLIIDEADALFTRKPDLKHIFNASWTRGTTIPRQVSISGVWTTVHFDPFCPKAIGVLGGSNLPRTLKSRAIEIRMVPRRISEVVEPFSHSDDFEFAVLRRKSERWRKDNAAALREAEPTVPNGLNNRAAMNWKLLLLMRPPFHPREVLNC